MQRVPICTTVQYRAGHPSAKPDFSADQLGGTHGPWCTQYLMTSVLCRAIRQGWHRHIQLDHVDYSTLLCYEFCHLLCHTLLSHAGQQNGPLKSKSYVETMDQSRSIAPSGSTEEWSTPRQKCFLLQFAYVWKSPPKLQANFVQMTHTHVTWITSLAS